MTTYWSKALLPQSVMFRLKPMNTRGPTTFSGKTQVVGTDAGFWVAKLTNFVIRTPDHIREWRAMIADLQGGLNDLVIGPFDCRQTPRYRGLPPIIGDIPHSDGSLFTDQSGYSQSTIRVSLVKGAALRATQLTLSIDQAGELKRGMYFTIWTIVGEAVLPRMYLITKPPLISDDEAVVTFLPPLRVAVKATDTVDFADPVTLMNLSDDDQGELNINLRRFSSPSIELQESWNGLS